jgi:hypothetical protein
MKHVVLFGALALSFIAKAQTGEVAAYSKISSAAGNMYAPLANSGRWGYVAAEGTNKIRVAAPFTGGGVLHLIDLNNVGAVSFVSSVYAVQLPLLEGTNNPRFGTSSVLLGDLNSDGQPDYMVGAPGLTSYGSIVILRSNGNTFNADTLILPPFLKDAGAEWGSHLYKNGNELLAGIEMGGGKVVSFTFNAQMQMLIEHVYDLNSPVLAQMLEAGDRFGTGITASDMDGDGISDLICGATGDDDGGIDYGAVYVIYRNADKTVKGVKKISTGNSNFSGFLNSDDDFGISIVPLGDLDQDGYPDIAVGAPGDDDGGIDIGAIWILFLNEQGNVKLSRKINRLFGSFDGDINAADKFGTRIASLGDFNSDGTIDLVAGAPEDDDGGSNRGAIYNLMIDYCAPHSAIYTYENEGPVVDFSISGGPGMSFLWNFDDGNYSELQNPTHTYASNGTYNVCLNVVGPCGGNMYCGPVQATGAGGLNTDNTLEQLLKVYPNPAKEHVIIESPYQLAQVRLTDLTGKVVALYKSVGDKTKIELSHLPAGLYFLELTANGERIVKKVQVQ